MRIVDLDPTAVYAVRIGGRHERGMLVSKLRYSTVRHGATVTGYRPDTLGRGAVAGRVGVPVVFVSDVDAAITDEQLHAVAVDAAASLRYGHVPHPPPGITFTLVPSAASLPATWPVYVAARDIKTGRLDEQRAAVQARADAAVAARARIARITGIDTPPQPQDWPAIERLCLAYAAGLDRLGQDLQRLRENDTAAPAPLAPTPLTVIEGGTP